MLCRSLFLGSARFFFAAKTIHSHPSNILRHSLCTIFLVGCSSKLGPKLVSKKAPPPLPRQQLTPHAVGEQLPQDARQEPPKPSGAAKPVYQTSPRPPIGSNGLHGPPPHTLAVRPGSPYDDHWQSTLAKAQAEGHAVDLHVQMPFDPARQYSIMDGMSTMEDMSKGAQAPNILSNRANDPQSFWYCSIRE